MKRIDLVVNDGSPLGVTMKTLWGQDGQIGCGGSEYLLLTLCEEWTKRGDIVRLYNDPREMSVSSFEQLPLSAYNPGDNRDVLINFRSPNPRTIVTNNCLKVWLSTDQFSMGDYAAFAPHVDKIVGISQRHAQFFKDTYNIQNMIVIDIPVRVQDFDAVQVEKIPNRIIFTSVPARGLDNLLRVYPIIQRAIPDVSLMITSDYRLWGVPPSNEHFRVKWINKSNVNYAGAMPRQQYVEELLKAQILLFPCCYDELFCVSVSEAQYAGAYPITSNMGALPTTNMGTVLGVDANNPANDKLFADEVIHLLSNPDELKNKQGLVQQMAKERFDPKRILAEWDEKIFK